MKSLPIRRNSSCGFFEGLITTSIKASLTEEFKIKMNTHKMNIKSIIDVVRNLEIVTFLAYLNCPQMRNQKVKFQWQQMCKRNAKVNLLTRKSTFLYPKLLIYYHFLTMKLPNHT